MLLYAEVLQDLRADPVLPQVGRKAQLDVGLDRVEALLLKLVGLELVDQADAAALLAHIEQYAAALLLDLLHCSGKLLAAVAAARAEHVAGQALGVHPAEHDRGRRRCRP